MEPCLRNFAVFQPKLHRNSFLESKTFTYDASFVHKVRLTKITHLSMSCQGYFGQCLRCWPQIKDLLTGYYFILQKTLLLGITLHWCTKSQVILKLRSRNDNYRLDTIETLTLIIPTSLSSHLFQTYSLTVYFKEMSYYQ